MANGWPHYDAPEFHQHGSPGENEYRAAAIAACRAAGLDCIRADCRTAPNDELAMHLLKFQSPVDGHFMAAGENWCARAKAAGVTRWQFDLRNGGDFARWAFLCKAYGAEELQFVVRPDNAAAARAVLGKWGLVLED